jgi:mycothiol synthase
MSDPSHLSPTLVTRPLTPDDLHRVVELVRAAELHDTGSSLIEPEDIRADWARPSYDLGRQSIGYVDAGTLVAYGEVHESRLEAYVHPDHRQQGIGTALFGWALARGREMGMPRVGQTVPVTNQDAIRLFKRHGARLVWTSWILELPQGSAIAAADLPPGHRLRAFDPDRDSRDVFEVVERAFNEWPNRRPSTYEDWAARVVARDDFEPWQLITVVADSDQGEQIVGACKLSITDEEGWVDAIAVAREARGRGLGRALLVAAFAEARLRGATRSRLNTDSRTGALGIYEHVGMAVTDTYEHYAVDMAER